MHSPSKGIRSIIIGIFVSILLAIIKGLAGIFGNSYALIADGIESISLMFSPPGCYCLVCEHHYLTTENNSLDYVLFNIMPTITPFYVLNG